MKGKNSHEPNLNQQLALGERSQTRCKCPPEFMLKRDLNTKMHVENSVSQQFATYCHSISVQNLIVKSMYHSESPKKKIPQWNEKLGLHIRKH